ncbi:hypothetical protein C2S53_012769 [Perilla frutescens var. hirtella]|uniref:RING-type E3 ubiquitin transferase n=1 Tax=Perilla frutescens var. hirtella TaxID=608512 RepID=A0AAD4P9F8_PERFH|nr:hypothetical protein C2S53_012769 [Perilla frutescens var. hirtella]
MASTDDRTMERQMAQPAEGYALSGKIMLSAIVILFAVVVFMVGLHLYARWYLVRLRRRQIERRRQRRGGRPHVVLYADSALAASSVDRGLDTAVLSSLPVFLYSATAEQPPSECAVCLSEFEEKEIVRLLPKCNHCFHIECIDMWFRSHSTCPLCRSPVEKVAGRAEAEPVVTPLEPVGETSLSEPGSSSAAGLCDACHHEGGCTTSSLGVRKGADLVGVRIEVPPRRADSVLELTQSSPAGRLLSFKRILSMGRRSPAASSSGGWGPTTPRGAGTSGGAGELDLESGTSELNRELGGVHTPR